MFLISSSLASTTLGSLEAHALYFCYPLSLLFLSYSDILVLPSSLTLSPTTILYITTFCHVGLLLTLTPKSLKVSLILHIDTCSLHPSPLYSLRGPVFPEPLAGIGVRWKKMPASLRRTLPSGMECGTEDQWIANGRPKSSPGPRDQRKGRYKGQA